MPRLLLLAMIAIWGGSYSAVKVVLDSGVPPFALVAGRFWIAVLCVQILLLLSGRAGGLRTAVRSGIPTGLALLAGYSLQTLGMQETTASMGGFLSGLIVLLVALGARIVFGERLRPPTLLGLALGTVGLALLCLQGHGDAAGQSSTRGILLQLGSAISYAAHVLLISRLSPPGNELAFGQWQLLVTAVGASALVPCTGGLGAVADYAASPLLLAMALYLGVLATGLGIAVQSRVQPRIPPSQVAVLFATQPAFAALAGALFLGERLGPAELAGGALIAVGVLVGSRAGVSAEPAR